MKFPGGKMYLVLDGSDFRIENRDGVSVGAGSWTKRPIDDNFVLEIDLQTELESTNIRSVTHHPV